jgi:hypothetical protein
VCVCVTSLVLSSPASLPGVGFNSPSFAPANSMRRLSRGFGGRPRGHLNYYLFQCVCLIDIGSRFQRLFLHCLGTVLNHVVWIGIILALQLVECLDTSNYCNHSDMGYTVVTGSHDVQWHREERICSVCACVRVCVWRLCMLAYVRACMCVYLCVCVCVCV